MLGEKTIQQVRDIVLEATSAHAIEGRLEQKVGDYYATFLDKNSIEAKGLSPLADEMARMRRSMTKRRCPLI
jgi:predicted metalloendopeptidase